MTSHNTDPLGNDGPKTATPAREVGLVSEREKNIYDAGDGDAACAVLVGDRPCGGSWAMHENGTIYVHAYAPDGVERPHPNLRLIAVDYDDFATGF